MSRRGKKRKSLREPKQWKYPRAYIRLGKIETHRGFSTTLIIIYPDGHCERQIMDAYDQEESLDPHPPCWADNYANILDTGRGFPRCESASIARALMMNFNEISQDPAIFIGEIK